MPTDIDPLAVRALSAGLTVLGQDTGHRCPLRLNAEQEIMLDALLRHDRVICLKARQQGISTVCLLMDLIHALVHPGQSVAIVADTADKAQGLLAKITDWVQEMGLSLDVENVTRITLRNGSTIDALSAVSRAESGESRTGRSKSYGMIHATELAFWQSDRATFSALLSTALPGARVVIESTASPADNLYRHLWHNPAGWRPVFCSVEQHAAYRAPASDISDVRWEEMRERHGFSDRSSASWWDRKLRTDMGGDTYRMLREYPIQPEQAFMFASGRWIHTYRLVSPVSESAGWRVYDESPQYPAVIGVDTGAGVGGDHSAIVVVCQHTRQIVATWHSNTTPIPELIAQVESARRRWNPVRTVVETNGIGAGVHQSLSRPGVDEHRSDTSEKALRFSLLARDIESGAIGVGEEIKQEVYSSVVDRNGKYTGRDDLLNALSFCLAWIAKHPYTHPVEPPDYTRVYSIADRERRAKRKSGA